MTDELSTKTRVVAVVAPGAYNNARYDFSFSDWKPSDNSIILYFAREFEYNINENELLKSIDELQRIILALFLCDSIPRKIHFFEYGESLSPGGEVWEKFWGVFGQPRTHFETEQLIRSKSSSRLGLFNPMPMIKIDYVAPENEIFSWFTFLAENNSISSSLQLIQESFGLAHELFTGLRIIDIAELSTVLLLLVSGLESLFTKDANSQADISFKFKTVGAAYYSKYVNVPDLSRNELDNNRKFSYKDFKTILGILYNLRSVIAHGNTNLKAIFFGGEETKSVKGTRSDLKRLFSLVRIGEVNEDMRSIYFAQLLLALQRLESHILEIFKSAKENLNKGVNILDEMLENSDSEQWPENI